MLFRDVHLRNPGNGVVADWIPGRYQSMAAHYDPEFDTVTYGDNCDRAARAMALRRVAIGDLILFLARLELHQDDRFTGKARFYLIGAIEVEEILRSVREQPGEKQMARFGANAHVRKGLNDPLHWDGFWVFAGTKRAGRFERGVPFARELCDRVMLAAGGERWSWNTSRSELQVIGSYTRTCRAMLAPGQPGVERRTSALFAAIDAANPGAIPD